MTHLILGEPAPLFTLPSPSRPDFHFTGCGGRYVLLGFLPLDPAQREAALAVVERNADLLSDAHISSFMFLRDPATFSDAVDRQGRRWFFDAEGAVSRLYGAVTDDGVENPIWILLDPSMRLLLMAPISAAEALFERLRKLPGVDGHAGTPLNAPVLIVPRVFEPDMCRRLIAFYEANGGAPSGVMREVDGMTVAVLDDFKRRRDASIEDEAFRNELRVRLRRRLLPEIEKAFQFTTTYIERYIVAHYDAADGGYFRPHRDNTTPATAHRRFAVSINLNAEDHGGGELRFPEFGTRTYRPPTGGAVVFSCSLLHEATAVTRGRRYAFLPFLYDQAGAEIRERNLHLLHREPTPEPAQSATIAAG
jgi:predicted 2-oxoglutarate/Fe(II)-dependent dioxygenase YbiX